jgi:hypothetical protein
VAAAVAAKVPKAALLPLIEVEPDPAGLNPAELPPPPPKLLIAVSLAILATGSSLAPPPPPPLSLLLNSIAFLRSSSNAKSSSSSTPFVARFGGATGSDSRKRGGVGERGLKKFG